MKELTIEQKAKRYDESLKSATIAYKDEDRHLKATLERIFPELKESENELTWLKNYISDEVYSLSMDIRDNEDRIKLKNLQKSLAWLEEQSKIISANSCKTCEGEQKPAERKDFISIPFGTDSELIEESITIPGGCYAVIEGRKVYIRKKVHSKKK